MKIKISEIVVDEGRRPIDKSSVANLAGSIKTVGLLNPVTVTKDHHLIAGAHRLEAYKLLGLTEIECNVMEISGLEAELAEIDENIVRRDIDPMDMDDLLLHRKEIYEAIYPETRAGTAQGEGMKRAAKKDLAEPSSVRSHKSFVDDTAEKTGVTPRIVRARIQTAKNLTPEVKAIVKKNGIGTHNALKLSRIKEPEKQKEVAEKLARHEIKTVEEALPPKPAPTLPKEPGPMPAPPKELEAQKREPTIKELLEEVRNPDIPRGYTIEILLKETDSLVENFCISTKRLLVNNSTLLADSSNKRQIAKVLEKAEAKIKEIKEIVK